MSVPAGGPSTINGIIYQMLRSLARASKLKIKTTVEEDEVVSASIILEPSTGGDLVEISDKTTVEQVKTRSDGSTWSLTDIVKEVLPDLYLAARSATKVDRYLFSTNGRMGRWSKVKEFFDSLATRKVSEGSEEPNLDNDKELTFGSSTPSTFWPKEAYTEETLFARIVDEVRERKVVKAEEIVTTRANLFHMLGRLDFIWEQTEQMHIAEIDHLLLTVAPARENIPEIRNALAFEMANLARQGDCEIAADDFFSKQGLDATPLSDWSILRQKAARYLDKEITLRRYDFKHDVRADEADKISGSWSPEQPVTLVCGESGYGKSWQLMSLANRLKKTEMLPLYIQARNDFDATLGAISKAICENIWGVDNPISLDRIASRLSCINADKHIWLAIIIDGSLDFHQINSLLLHPWNDMGIRIAFACHPQIANEIPREYHDKVKTVAISNFTLVQIQDYLRLHLQESWSKVPQDLLQILRQPLLANLYVQTVAKKEWQPSSEYELFHANWDRMFSTNPTSKSLDIAKFKTLIGGVIDNEPYPWKAEQLLSESFDEECLDRLCKSGCLLSNSDGTYECFHDRLLNWSVAVVLVDRFENEQIQLEKLGTLLKGFASGQETRGNRLLGYVAMDVIWLMSNHYELYSHLPAIIPYLEDHYVQTEDLYREHLPTIGPSIAKSLFQLLEQRKLALFSQRQVIDGLCKLNTDIVGEKAIEYLVSSDPRLQRYSFFILQQLPDGSCLPKLWALYKEILKDPSSWLEDNENKSRPEQDAYNALKTCCQQNPDWLLEAIKASDPDNHPVHTLASLIASLDDSEGRRIWESSKSSLIEIIDRENQWTIARCMMRYPNESDIEWHLDAIDQCEYPMSGHSLTGLTRIDPEQTLKLLRNKLLSDWQYVPQWWFYELQQRLPQLSHDVILSWANKDDHSLDVIFLYDHQEAEVPASLLEPFLGKLENILDICIKEGKKVLEEHYRLFDIFAKMNTALQINRFLNLKGSPLEKKLSQATKLLGARPAVYADSFARKPLLEILFKINGQGFTDASNELLKSESHYGQLDGLNLAIKRPDNTTIELCKNLSMVRELFDGDAPLIQNLSAYILAAEEHWELLHDFFEEWWPEIFDGTSNLLHCGNSLSQEIRQRILERISSEGVQTPPGLINLLGFSQNSKDVPILRNLLSKTEKDSDAEKACLLGLKGLGDKSNECVPLFADALDGKNIDTAELLLAINRTDAAYEELLDHIQDKFRLSPAINLLNDERTRERAIAITKQHLENQTDWFWNNDLKVLIQAVKNMDIVEELYQSDILRDRALSLAYMYEGRAWQTGLKATGIQAVAIFDREKAIHAVKKAFENLDSKDRQYYPNLIVELMGTEAYNYLLQALGVEGSKAIEVSIRRALATTECSEYIRMGLESGIPEEIIASCRAIGLRDEDSDYDNVLHELVADRRMEVHKAALAAMERRGKYLESEKAKANLIDQNTSKNEKWIWANSYLELADPGDQHRPMPDWIFDSKNTIPPVISMYLAEQIKNKRKSLFEKLSKNQ